MRVVSPWDGLLREVVVAPPLEDRFQPKPLCHAVKEEIFLTWNTMSVPGDPY